MTSLRSNSGTANRTSLASPDPSSSRDTIVAANHLASVASGGDTAALDAACRGIEAERKPEIVRAQKLQRRGA
jgi:hypothetical protein